MYDHSLITCSQYKVTCRFVGADFTKEDEITKMCDNILKFYPNGIDILINNAGITSTNVNFGKGIAGLNIIKKNHIYCHIRKIRVLGLTRDIDHPISVV